MAFSSVEPAFFLRIVPSSAFAGLVTPATLQRRIRPTLKGGKLMKRICYLLLFSLALICASSAQNASLPSGTVASQAQDADEKVEAIINGILKRGEGTLDGGVKTSTWVPPSDEDQSEIRELGHGAIRPLYKALDSPIPFRQLLAVRLLEAVGGADIVPTLKRGLDPSRWVIVRMQSLSSLRSAPDNLAIPIIRAAQDDADPRVAKRAKDFLSTYYDLHDPATPPGK